MSNQGRLFVPEPSAHAQGVLSPSAVISSAVISSDGRYRYLLERRWAPGRCVVWVMLNPSTADAVIDDPTIRRVVSFSRAARVGAGGAKVVNLFALRATDPQELLRADDPVGPENDEHIELAACDAALVVVAWGAHKMAAQRVPAVLRLVRRYLAPYCLGVTASGSPRHPLYVSGAQRFEDYEALR